MFDRYVIDEKTVRNVLESGKAVGFAFEARLGYYRGLGLSMVEDLIITVDGKTVDRDLIRFRNNGTDLTLKEMETAYDRRWEFGTPATITVLLPGGLASGRHKLELKEDLRISYLPFNGVAFDSKTITIA